METFLDRLKAERRELDDRLGKLNVFLANDDAVKNLSNKMVALLIAQSHAMTNYLDILNRRLDMLT